MPSRINRVAAAGNIQRVNPQRAAKDAGWGRSARGGRISPSLRKANSMEFQTRGLGSLVSLSTRAETAIRFNSASNARQVGQVSRWACCSTLLPSSISAKLCCSSTQVIPLSPQAYADKLTAITLPTAVLAPLPELHLYYFFPCSGFGGLFGSLHLEQVAQFHPRFVQLGLAIADRASHDCGNLIMLVSFDVVKYKDGPIARRETVHCLPQLQPINGPG